MVNRTISWLNNWLIDWLTCVQVTEPEYYHSMVKMHLSFLLDLHTDECDCSFLYEKQVPGIIIIIILSFNLVKVIGMLRWAPGNLLSLFVF